MLPWGASELPTRVQAKPEIPSAGIGGRAARPSAPQAQAIGGGDLEGPRRGIITAGTKPVEPGTPVARLNDSAKGSIPDTAKRFPRGSVAGVREFTPGSKAHSEAIASIVGSDEFKDTVAPLARLYFAYFDRFPDYEGLDHYIGARARGTPLESIADEFAGSPEFNMRYGSVDNVAFIDRVYRNVFGAPPDSAQRAYWVGQLDSGMTRGQVMLAFSEGSDFRTLTGNEVFVTMAYAETLRRAPSPSPAPRFERGISVEDVVEVVSSGEEVAVYRERGDSVFVVKEVPAQICPNCGEDYVDSAVAAELLRSAEELSRSGAKVDVSRYAAAA